MKRRVILSYEGPYVAEVDSQGVHGEIEERDEQSPAKVSDQVRRHVIVGEVCQEAHKN